MKKMMFNDRYALTEAVLQGIKTVTRRLPNPPKSSYGGLELLGDVLTTWDCNGNEIPINPPYTVGEIVAVAQSYNAVYGFDWKTGVRPDGFTDQEFAGMICGWDNKMFVQADLMPHQIRVLDVRAERLQDITEEDCLKEGIDHDGELPYIFDDKLAHRFYYDTPKEAYATLIDKISGKGTWERNPFVWRIEFELIK